MKINWFSPLPPGQTDIAHFTTRVLPALATQVEVTLWSDQSSWTRELEANYAVKRYRPERLPVEELNRADFNIYNIGNNPQFHGGIWHASQQMSGVVIMHDLRLHHFFDGIFRVKRRDLQTYLFVMQKYYGERGRLDGKDCFLHDGTNIDEMAERYPLTALASENALGVVVHNLFSLETIANETGASVAYLPLPFPASKHSKVDRTTSPPYRLILFGYIGRNRRVESVVRALAEAEFRDQFRLDVFGTILNDEKQLRALIGSLGLNKQVTLHGYKTEAELDAALSRAHLAINLRYPTMGEASGSQLRIWSHSLPSLVSDVGWYSTLPPDTVAFVSSGNNEIDDIKRHLRSFLSERESFIQMGQRGRGVLEDRHSPQQYVQSLLVFLNSISNARVRLAGLELAERAAALATNCFPAALLDQSFHRVAMEVHALIEGE